MRQVLNEKFGLKPARLHEEPMAPLGPRDLVPPCWCPQTLQSGTGILTDQFQDLPNSDLG